MNRWWWRNAWWWFGRSKHTSPKAEQSAYGRPYLNAIHTVEYVESTDGLNWYLISGTSWFIFFLFQTHFALTFHASPSSQALQASRGIPPPNASMPVESEGWSGAFLKLEFHLLFHKLKSPRASKSSTLWTLLPSQIDGFQLHHFSRILCRPTSLGKPKVLISFLLNPTLGLSFSNRPLWQER